MNFFFLFFFCTSNIQQFGIFTDKLNTFIQGKWIDEQLRNTHKKK